MPNTKTLITGGAGFIGSHVARKLINRGYEVHILDNLSTGREENIPSDSSFYECDIRSDEASFIIKNKDFDVIIHHAAQMDVRKSVKEPVFDADVNICGFLNLMEAGRKCGVKKIIFASTGGAIYGEPVYAPQDENHPEKPLSPYGITKLSAEKYLNFYRDKYEIETISLRYSNVYGPRQNSKGDAGVVAIFSRQMLCGENPIIHGAGNQTRDYVFVDDVARANVFSLEYDGSGVFNIGTSRETSVNDLFVMIHDEVGADVKKKHGPPQPGEQKRSVLEWKRAKEELGWEPQVPVRSGIERTVSWFRERFI